MPRGNYLLKLVSALNKSEVDSVETVLSKGDTKRSVEVLQLFRVYLSLAVNPMAFSSKKLIDLLEKEEIDQKFIKHIHFWKKTLYDKILVCLRELYEHSESLNVRIEKHRANGAILWRKGMQVQAISELKKALKLAEGYDWLVYLRISLNIRIYMYEFESRESEYEHIGEKSAMALDKIQHEIYLYNIYEEVYLAVRDKRSNSRDIFQNIPGRIAALFNRPIVSECFAVEQREIVKLFEYLSLESNSALCYVMAVYRRHVLGDYDGALVYLELLLSMNENEKYTYLDQEAYLNLLNNILNNKLRAGRYKEMNSIIRKLSEVNPHNPGMEAKKLHHLHYYKMISLLAVKNYHEVTLLGKVIEESWNKYEKLLSHSRKLVFYYNLSTAFLIEGNQEEARKWNEKNLEDRNYRIRPDIRFLARIVELLICFDEDVLTKKMDSSFRVPHYAQSLLRSLKKSKQDYSVKIIIVKTIRDVSLRNEPCEITTIFLNLKKILLENEKSSSSEFSEFVDWIDRRFGKNLDSPAESQ